MSRPPTGYHNTPNSKFQLDQFIGGRSRTRVQLWDHDLTSGDDLLDEDITGDDGRFVIGPVTNSEPFQGKQDIYLKLVAENEAAVVNESYGGTTYAFQSDIRNDCPSGDYDTTITLTNAQSGAFFVADAILTARDKWIQWRTDKNPGRVEIELAPNYERSCYYPSQQYIHIESGNYSDITAPDTYDRDVLVHEYGHFLEGQFGFFNNSPGGDHDWYIAFCYGNCNAAGAGAAAEGFSHWFACHVRGISRLENTYNSFGDTAWYSVENGVAGVNGNPSQSSSPNNGGSLFEAAVAGLFWDIVDQQDTMENYSTYGVYPFPNHPNPDSVGDTLQNLASNIMSALLDRSVFGHLPDSTWDFWAAWHNNPTLGHTKGLRDVYYEHGDDIFVSCCVGVRGDVNMDGLVDLNDLSSLVSYITGGGFVLPCPAEANVNGVGIVDISDVSALVSNLTGGGYVLPPCSP